MNSLLGFWSEWLPTLLNGLAISLKVTGASLLFGIPMGLLMALCRQSKVMPLRLFSVALIEFGRGAPALIILQFVYFGLPNAGLSLSSFGAATVALAWNTGAYTSEIIRAGLEAVPHGQREAAAAIGLTRIDSLRYVILPQSLRISLPALLGFSIAVLQTSSLCFSIALPELVSQAYVVGSNTFEYMPILVLAALLYAAICLPATVFVSALERHLDRHSD